MIKIPLSYTRYSSNHPATVSEKFQIKDGLIPIPLYLSLIAGTDVWFPYRYMGLSETVSSGYFSLNQPAVSYSITGFYNGERTRIIIGNLSYMVLNDSDNIVTLISDGTETIKTTKKSIGKIGIYILGAIKFSGLRIGETDNYRRISEIQVENDQLVLLASESIRDYERKKIHTVEDEVLDRLKGRVEGFGVEVRYVSQDYLNSFLKPKIHIPTNSISDYQRIAQEIIEKTFPRLLKEKKLPKPVEPLNEPTTGIGFVPVTSWRVTANTGASAAWTAVIPTTIVTP